MVFQDRGLTLLAAPWKYSLTAKLQRLTSRTQMRDYDLEDAVHYLRQIVVASAGQAVPRADIHRWAAHYNHTIADSVVDSVHRQYRRVYNGAGIV